MKEQIEASSISVALCTCNGSQFLIEQLNSISRQSRLPAELIVCDDFSSDSTPVLLNDYAKKAPFTVRLYYNKQRLGSQQNYAKAISLCNADYIALSDQDDTWKPEKLELLMQAMRELEGSYGADIPLLVHSDLVVCDEKGKVIVPSFMKLRKIRHYGVQPLKKILAQNFVTGNTVLINRPLAEAALPIPEEAVMHDWWLALVAASKGRIGFINQPTVFYRQHSANVVGANSFYAVKNLMRMFDLKTMDQELTAIVRQADALQRHLQGVNKQGIVLGWLEELVSAFEQGGFIAIVAANRYGIKKQGAARNAMFLLLLLMRNYRK